MHKYNFPHRRYNPLKGEWILVSPHRTQRPWQGKQESSSQDNRPEYDPKCYLCPGNVRANGENNPNYTKTFTFTNDFAALLPENNDENFDHPFFKSEIVKGTCKVICFSPKHNLTIAEMEKDEILNVINLWIDEFNNLKNIYKWVQIFENKGEIMGCSNPHPHGQIWASDFLPDEISKENFNQKKYFLEKNSILLIDYIKYEKEDDIRIIAENDCWIVTVPYWALWPYETILLPKRHIKRLDELQENEKELLADILKILLVKYDNLFETSFPYSMGWHGAPNDNENYEYWQLHAHFYPPLLRSSTIKKFMVGYEMLGEAQRDITAEYAAEVLKSLNDIHYKKR